MHEIQILDAIDAITLGKLSFEEKSIIVADIKSELTGRRYAGNLSNLVLSKLENLSKGMYKIAQPIATYYQDFNEQGGYPVARKTFGEEEINKFLEKMTSTEYTGTYFKDQWPFYHPTENMHAEGIARHYSDFILTNK